uniref:Uncharacterized protein n=1 Tax=Trepomonas sp. PC1 TaxID=1076344 RepID=A0A146K1Z5_9EUKA|eukprot:JAP90747.1 Hypothetical protein TPC1_17863 [Trepomonas sp. PC1]
MNIEQFIQAVNLIVDTTADVQQKQMANQMLIEYEATPDNWLICSDLLVMDDVQSRYFGYKYLMNILKNKPNMLTDDNYQTIKQIIAGHLIISQPHHLQQKLIQIALQLIVMNILSLEDILTFSVENMEQSQQTCVSLLKLLTQVLKMIGNDEPTLQTLGFRRLMQLKQEAESLNLSILLTSVTNLIQLEDYELTLNAIKLFNALIPFQPPGAPLQFLFDQSQFCDFGQKSNVNSSNVTILKEICHGLTNFLAELAKIENLALSKDSYQKFCFIFLQLSKCLMHSDNFEFAVAFAQFYQQISKSKNFVLLIQAQMADVGRTLQNHDLLATATQNAVKEMTQFKLSCKSQMCGQFLSLYVFNFIQFTELLEKIEIQEYILEVYEDILSVDRCQYKKLYIQMTKDQLEKIIMTVMNNIQKPSQITFYIDEFNQRQKLPADSENQLYKQQIQIIKTIIHLNKGYSGIYDQLLNELLKNYDMNRLLQLTFVFEAFSTPQTALKTVFALLNLVNFVNDVDQKILIMQSIFYVVSKTEILKDQQLNFQLTTQAMQSIQEFQDEEFEQIAVQSLIECIKSVQTAELEQKYVNEIIPQIYDFATISLQTHNKFDLYKELSRRFSSEAVIEQLLGPVQQEFIHTFLNLDQLHENQLSSLEIVQQLNRIVGIYVAISEELSLQQRFKFCSTDILKQIQQMMVFYSNFDTVEILYLLKNCFKLLGLVPDKELNTGLIANQSEQLFQQEQIQPINLYFIQLFKETPDVALQEKIFLYLIHTQLQQQEINIELNDQIYFLLQLFLNNQASQYGKVVQKQDFLSGIVTLATNYQFQTNRFRQVYLQNRESFSNIILRRSGPEFIKFALREIKISHEKHIEMLQDLIKMGQRSIGISEVCGIMNLDQELLDAVIAGDEAALIDLGRMM